MSFTFEHKKQFIINYLNRYVLVVSSKRAYKSPRPAEDSSKMYTVHFKGDLAKDQ